VECHKVEALSSSIQLQINISKSWLWGASKLEPKAQDLLTSKCIQSFEKIRLRVLFTMLGPHNCHGTDWPLYNRVLCTKRGHGSSEAYSNLYPSNSVTSSTLCTSYVGDRHGYTYLPFGQRCTLAYLFPVIHLAPREDLRVQMRLWICEHGPYQRSLCCWDWGVISGISEGIGDSATATWLYKNLLQEIPKSLNKIATTLLDLKVHSDCLAAMVLQNSTMFLDMITAPPPGWDLCHVRKRMLLLC
jgi:hypothetical protein